MAELGSSLILGDLNVAGNTNCNLIVTTSQGLCSSFGGVAINPNTSIANQTSYIQILAGFGGATNSSGIAFHNPGISTASIEYVNTDANTGYFNFKADDTFNVRISGNTVWHAGNDGAGSGLDADLLDGLSSNRYLTFAVAHSSNWTNATTMTGKTYWGGFHGGSGNGYFSFGGAGGACDIMVDGEVYVSEGVKKLWKAGDVVTSSSWNDLAEYMESNIDEYYPGDVIAIDDNGKLYKANDYNLHNVVGVYSDTFGFSLGGEQLENEEKLPIGISGRVNVKVVYKEDIKVGDLLVSSCKPGYAVKTSSNKINHIGCIIGKVTSLKPIKIIEDGEQKNITNDDMVTMMVMLS